MNFQVYPNPSTGKVKINLGSTNNAEWIYLLTLNGNIVSRHRVKAGVESTELDISNYPKGMYLIRRVQNKKYSKGKLIILQ